jgi:glucose/arabinose dehydrogenase
MYFHNTIYSPVIFILLIFQNSALFAVQEIVYESQKVKILNTKYNIKLPKSLKLDYLVKLDKPRIISISKHNEMFIGSKSGYVYRLTAPYKKADKLVKLNNYPHSIVVRGGVIYIAQTNGLYRAPYKTGQKKITHSALSKYISLPGGFGHNSRTVRVGRDNKLYLSLGISGNCSNQYIGEPYLPAQRRGGVIVLNEKDKSKLIWNTFASGLRNPVGFDWHPKTGIMYASNNGPDHWGFEQPREYFSKVEAGSFHGMPWFQVIKNKVQKDNCINNKPPQSERKVQKPVQTFDARNAPMAVGFIHSGELAQHYFGDALVALHGSWAVPNSGKLKSSNAGRREPKLVLVRFDNGVSVKVDNFLTGFQLQDGNRWARPIGVINAPDGNIYFTSDAGINGLFRIKIK